MRSLRVGLLTLVPSMSKRYASNNNSELEREINVMKKKLQVLEESNLSNGLVRLYASRKIKALSMQRAIYIFSNPSFHAPIYCHEHLPVILSHIINALDNLPVGLNSMPAILKVRGTLLNSFLKIVDCHIPTSKESIEHFQEILEEIEEEHANVDLVKTIAVGILELKDRMSLHRAALFKLKNSSPNWSNIRLTENDIMPYEELADIQEPLDDINRFIIRYNFLSRMLLNMNTGGKKVGMVDLEINLENVVRSAVDEAKQICTDHFGDCPDVEFSFSADCKNFRFPFMSTTIRYIVVELLKNAFRATVETHMKRNEVGIVTCDDMPPVSILVHLKEGAKHACIRISDEGNGMPQRDLEKAMSYSFTSVSKPAMSLEDGDVVVNDSPSPLAGYGYGLPMSRVYAMSFGGDLTLQTMEGFGTRAYYYICLE